MKVLVTGANGQLGREVVDSCVSKGMFVIATDIHFSYENINTNCKFAELNICDKTAVGNIICKEKPDAVIHCAAWTNVDGAESENNKNVVYDINVNGTKNISDACCLVDCKLVFISSDYIFDGKGNFPRKPDDINYAPLNYYGYTKFKAEQYLKSNCRQKLFIIRISWLFGKYGKNFVDTIVNLSHNHDSIRVVDDQIGRPTYACDLSDLLSNMITTEKYGTYHVCNSGRNISWYEFAVEIIHSINSKTVVIPVTSEEYGLSVAERPKNSRFCVEKLDEAGFGELPDWKDSLCRYIEYLIGIKGS